MERPEHFEHKSVNFDDVVESTEDQGLVSHMTNRRANFREAPEEYDIVAETSKINIDMTKLSTQLNELKDCGVSSLENIISVAQKYIDKSLLKSHIENADEFIKNLKAAINKYDAIKRSTVIALGRFNRTYKPTTPPPATSISVKLSTITAGIANNVKLAIAAAEAPPPPSGEPSRVNSPPVPVPAPTPVVGFTTPKKLEPYQPPDFGLKPSTTAMLKPVGDIDTKDYMASVLFDDNDDDNVSYGEISDD